MPNFEGLNGILIKMFHRQAPRIWGLYPTHCPGSDFEKKNETHGNTNLFFV